LPFAKGTINVHVRVKGDAMRPSHLARVRKYLELAKSDSASRARPVGHAAAAEEPRSAAIPDRQEEDRYKEEGRSSLNARAARLPARQT